MTALFEEKFEQVVKGILASEYDFISPLGPLIIAAAAFGLIEDSRSFARAFEVEHALVIRECNSLEKEHSLIKSEMQQQKSQRVYYRLTQTAWSMIPSNINE
ncbi:MAG: hypothetical protein AAGJ37_07235 [Pseudomonadota bacterium]